VSGKVTQARTENDRGFRGELSSESYGGFDLIVVGHKSLSRKPAIVAVMKFASVPANIARNPSRARS
jgi:hypothetical protein